MNVQQNNKKTAVSAPNPTRAAQVAATPTAEPVKEAKAPKVDAMLAKKVKIITEGGKNPKREGSKSHARFAIYKDGMTVESYILASVAAGQERRAARQDITWDQDHKYIELND